MSLLEGMGRGFRKCLKCCDDDITDLREAVRTLVLLHLP